MKSSLKKQAERFLREQKNYKRWLAVFLCLAVVVTIGTTAALKYKGIAVTSDDSATEAMHMEQTEGNTEEIPEGMRRHVHTEACYAEQPVLICEAAKAEAGEAADAGAADAGTSNAGAAEEPKPADTAQGHVHSDSCYEVTGGTEKLTCTKEEHTHGDGCYETKVVTETVTKTVPETVNEEVTDEDGNVTTVSKTVDKTVEETVEKEEEVLTCAKEEHSHGASCYTVEGGERTLVCGKEEGEGAEAPAAEAAVPAVVNAEAAAVPAAVNAEAAAVPAAETAAPAATEAATENAPATEAASTADAEAGAVTESTDTADVADAAAENTENADVAEETTGEHVHDDSCYELQMVLICGKEEGELEPIEPLSDEMNLVQTAETENYSVTVTYSESAMIPEEAVLQVFEYAKDSDRYIQRCEELGYQPDFLLNIGFFVDNSEVEPKKPVDIKITDKNVKNADGYDIVHFTEDGAEPVDNNTSNTGNGMKMEFSVDSFSDYSGMLQQRETNGPQIAEVAPIGSLAHEKKVEPGPVGKDGYPEYYDLTLNVAGAVGSSGEKAKVDILFVLDTSGSMAWSERGKEYYGTSRRVLANDAIKNLISDLDSEDSGVDAKYKLITFSDKANTSNAGSWQSGSYLKNRLDNSATGGTNYEDALEKAGTAIAAKRDEESKTIVIFMTDGAPTYYNNDWSWDGLGGNGSTTTNETVDKAVAAAGGINCDYFFAVGFGAEMTRNTPVGETNKSAYQIISEIAGAVKKEGTVANATTTTDLTAYFEDFKKSLKTIFASEVTFTDKLTKEVDFVEYDENGTVRRDENGDVVRTSIYNGVNGNWTCKITNAEGKEATAEEYAAAGMKAEYDGNEGLKVSFNPGYVLEQGYTYTVSTKITTNSLADKKYAESGYAHPDKGDENTGLKSSGQQGIFCNEDNSAKVSYKYAVGGTVTEDFTIKDYPMPVVQIGKKPEVEPPVAQEMTHRKYIANVEDDIYDLTLDLTGRVGSERDPAKYDILFVVDTSGSMKESATVTKTETKDVLTCGKRVHTHNSRCDQKTTYANCNKEEHTHSWKNCGYSIWNGYQCGKEEHTHDASCGEKTTVYTCGYEEHSHTVDCYETRTVTETESTTRIEAAKTAIKSLVDEIENNKTDGVKNIEAKYNLITFASNANNAGTWVDGDAFKGRVDNTLKNPNGGTNYEDALTKAGTAIESGSGREDTTKIVIFLTDGAPTANKTFSNNTGNGYSTEYGDYQGALKGAATIKCQEFYVIGFGNGLDGSYRWNNRYTGYKEIIKTGAQILEDVADAAIQVPQQKRNSVTTDDLQATFAEITANIKQFRCHHVTVTDTLSPYVEVNSTINLDGSTSPANLSIKVTNFETGALVAEGKGNVEEGAFCIVPEGDRNKNTSEAVRKITADYSNGKVTLNFNEAYQLEYRYRYEVTVQVRATEAAYKDAENFTSENDYPYVGGVGTDVPGTAEADKISEGRKGFFTNAKAEVSFVYSEDSNKPGESGKAEYERPVIRVSSANLILRKTVEGLSETEARTLFEKLEFSLDGKVITDKEGKNPITKAMIDEAIEAGGESGIYTITVIEKEVTPGTHTVTENSEKAEVAKFNRETSYMTEVGDETAEDNDVKATISLGTNQNGIVAFTNSYTPITEVIKWRKVDGDGEQRGIFEDVRFVIRRGVPVVTDKMSDKELLEAVRVLDEGRVIAEVAIDDEGNARFEMIDSEEMTETFELPVGEYTVEEVRSESNPLSGYLNIRPFKLIVSQYQDEGVKIDNIPGFPNRLGSVIARKEGGVTTITVQNKQMFLDELQILKVGAVTGGTVNGLEGAQFNLYKGEEAIPENQMGGTYTSGESGLITGLPQLAAGETYYLEEVKAPDGYMLLTDGIKFRVDVDKYDGSMITVEVLSPGMSYIAVEKDGSYKKYADLTEEEKANTNPYAIKDGKEIWTLAITNNTGAELPVTGGPGTIAYTFGGLAMIIAVSLMYGLSMRRKREKGGLN